MLDTVDTYNLLVPGVERVFRGERQDNLLTYLEGRFHPGGWQGRIAPASWYINDDGSENFTYLMRNGDGHDVEILFPGHPARVVTVFQDRVRPIKDLSQNMGGPTMWAWLFIDCAHQFRLAGFHNRDLEESVSLRNDAIGSDCTPVAAHTERLSRLAASLVSEAEKFARSFAEFQRQGLDLG